MKRKIIVVVVVALTLILVATTVSTAPTNGGVFDEFGYKRKARICLDHSDTNKGVWK